MRRGPVRRLLAALLAASVAVLAACSPVTIDLPTSCSPICTGTIHGAAYTILMPKSWNGTLLLYSHGYRVVSGKGVGKPALSQADTTGTGRDGTSQALLAAGYALTGSSYSSNGWAVHDAVVAADDLHERFVELMGQPKRIYVWGSSLGGLITELIAERFGWVDGAAPLCGVVAGPLLTFDHLLEAVVLTKALLVPGLQVGGWTSPAQARRQLLAASVSAQRAAGDFSGKGAAKVVFIAGMLGLPSRTQEFTGGDLRSLAAAAAQALQGYLFLAITALYEAAQRFNGNPAQVTTGDVSQPLNPRTAAHVRDLHGDPKAYAAAVTSMAPVSATTSARHSLAASGDPTGDLRIPTMTMHTEYDPVALASDETILRNRVASNGKAGRLLQLYIAPPSAYSPRTGPPYGVSHCAFAARQMTGLIGALDTWVRTGKRPSEPDLTRDIGPGFDPHFGPPTWPSGAAR